jgi:hypothetical protein
MLFEIADPDAAIHGRTFEMKHASGGGREATGEAAMMLVQGAME